MDFTASAVNYDHSAAYFFKPVCGFCHTCIVVAEKNDIVRSLRYGYSHCAALKAVAFKQGFAYVARKAVAFNDRKL